jgi:hypothetical protein
MKTKFILYLLVALLGVFIIQGMFFGIFIFVTLLKYIVIASVIATIFYVFSRSKKE